MFAPRHFSGPNETMFFTSCDQLVRVFRVVEDATGKFEGSFVGVLPPDDLMRSDVIRLSFGEAWLVGKILPAVTLRGSDGGWGVSDEVLQVSEFRPRVPLLDELRYRFNGLFLRLSAHWQTGGSLGAMFCHVYLRFEDNFAITERGAVLGDIPLARAALGCERY